MAMTAEEFLRVMQPNPTLHRGNVALNALAKLAGYTGSPMSAAWQQAMASPPPANEYTPSILDSVPEYDPAFIAALQGYTFNPTADAERAGYQVSGPDGRAQVINWGDKDSSFDKFAYKAIPIGIGALGAGAALGAFGGAGGIGSSVAGAGGEAASSLAAYGGSLTPAQVAATATGLDLGAAGAAGGLGLTEAVYGAGGALGAGAGGAAMTGGISGMGAAAAGGGGLLAALGGAKDLLPVAGSLLGTGLQINSANNARDDMQTATKAANDLQRYMYDTTRADNMPALTARNSALQQMQALLADPSSITKAPDYQFGMDQGTKALNNGAAARGMSQSGAADRARIRFGQDFASTKLNESANRLMALASGGQGGASQIGGAGANYAGQVGNALMQQGDANAAVRIGQGNAIADTINGLTAYGVRKNWWGG